MFSWRTFIEIEYIETKSGYKSPFPLWNYFFANRKFEDIIRFDVYAIFYKFKIEIKNVELDSFKWFLRIAQSID